MSTAGPLSSRRSKISSLPPRGHERGSAGAGIWQQMQMGGELEGLHPVPHILVVGMAGQAMRSASARWPLSDAGKLRSHGRIFRAAPGRWIRPTPRCWSRRGAWRGKGICRREYAVESGPHRREGRKLRCSSQTRGRELRPVRVHWSPARQIAGEYEAALGCSVMRGRGGLLSLLVSGGRRVIDKSQYHWNLSLSLCIPDFPIQQNIHDSHEMWVRDQKSVPF